MFISNAMQSFTTTQTNRHLFCLVSLQMTKTSDKANHKSIHQTTNTCKSTASLNLSASLFVCFCFKSIQINDLAKQQLAWENNNKNIIHRVR